MSTHLGINKCHDFFTLRVERAIKCVLKGPSGTTPVGEGDEFTVSFTYQLGRPAIKQWTLTWYQPDKNGGKPTGTLSPSSPNQWKTVKNVKVPVPPREVQTGTVMGTAPRLPRGVDYHNYSGRLGATSEEKD